MPAVAEQLAGTEAEEVENSFPLLAWARRSRLDVERPRAAGVAPPLPGDRGEDHVLDENDRRVTVTL